MEDILDVHKIILMINKNDENSEAVAMVDEKIYKLKGTTAISAFELVEDIIKITKGDCDGNQK